MEPLIFQPLSACPCRVSIWTSTRGRGNTCGRTNFGTFDLQQLSSWPCNVSIWTGTRGRCNTCGRTIFGTFDFQQLSPWPCNVSIWTGTRERCNTCGRTNSGFVLLRPTTLGGGRSLACLLFEGGCLVILGLLACFFLTHLRGVPGVAILLALILPYPSR